MPSSPRRLQQDISTLLGIGHFYLALTYFNTTPKFWLNLQTSYDLATVAATSEEEIQRTIRPRAAA